MSRVKIKFPDEKPLFECSIPVRIGDINYGKHLGNDAVLSIIHEARMQMLCAWGFEDELNAGGNSLIMADVMMTYKGEAYYGDMLHVKIYSAEIGSGSFDLLYLLSVEREGKMHDIAHAKTGMVCYDYTARKIVAITNVLKSRLSAIDI